MATPAKTRTVTSKAFRRANELDPSELPAKLEVLQKYVLDNVEYDCRHFAGQIATWKDNELYLHFEPTWEEFVTKHIKQPIAWVTSILDSVTILDSPQTPTPKATADVDHTQHLQLAIASLTREIEQLENLGTRPGSLAASTTGGKYLQHQWVHSGKPKYVRKSEVATYQQEIERGREVQKLRDRLELLQSMV